MLDHLIGKFRAWRDKSDPHHVNSAPGWNQVALTDDEVKYLYATLYTKRAEIAEARERVEKLEMKRAQELAKSIDWNRVVLGAFE